MRRAARTDDNHGAIVAALRKIGCSVLSLAPLGKGAPDALVTTPCGRRTFLVEIKDGAKPPSARKLTPDEAAFHASWLGELYVVESVEDAIRTVGMTD